MAGCKDGTKRYHFVFLDKNHPPNAIERVVSDITSVKFDNKCVVKKLYMVPKLNESHQLATYPFTTNLVC